MSDPLLQHLARIKLDELRAHHQSVESHYQGIEDRLAQPGVTDVEQLEALVEGLSSATFAMKPLHPEASDLRSHLRLLRLEVELGRADLTLVRRWCDQLREQIARGRTRARFSYLFGRLLEQDMVGREPASEPLPANTWPLAEAGADVDASLLDEVWARYPELFEPLSKRVATFADKEATAPATREEVVALLRAVVQNPLRGEPMRAAAQRILGDGAQVHEYANVLTILLHHFPDWRWSAAGASVHMHWVHGKARPTADAPLLDHLFVNLLGMRFALMLREVLDRLNTHRHPHQRPAPRGPDFDLLDLPEATSNNDPRRPESWARHRSDMRQALLTDRRLGLAMQLSTECLPASLVEVSEGGYRNAPKTTRKVALSPTETVSAMSVLLAEVNAHLQLLREVSPECRPHVLQTDFREFFGRLPHATVLALAERLGLPESWTTFLTEWLAMPVAIDGQVTRVQRGVARDHLLSWAFTALMGWIVDLEVQRCSGHPPLRVVDDLFLITDDADSARRGYEALLRCVVALGIEINQDKSGFVQVQAAEGSDSPAPSSSGMPEGLPQWGCLELTAQGRWQIARERTDTLLIWIRSQLDDARSALDLVQRYNREVTYVMFGLGSSLHLGEAHRAEVRQEVVRLHQDLFEPGEGVVERLAALASALDDVHPTAMPIPLVHWPITAGGLGLLNPLILLVATDGEPRLRVHPPDWPEWDGPLTRGQLNDFRYKVEHHQRWWLEHQNTLAQPRRFQAPPEIRSLAQMTHAFIARGSEIGGRTQETLSAYWRWVVATYGPPLLDAVGTFSFLPTELVPLPLILKQRGIVLPPTPTQAESPPAGDDDDIPF